MATPEFVKNKLDFAKIRLEELKSLNNGNLAGANPKKRQQLIQEFFFHLVGAIDFLAQAINISKHLSIDIEDVNFAKVIEKLNKKFGNNNQISKMLKELHPHTYKKPLPVDPYSVEGCLFRILVYRNTATHQKYHPFNFGFVVGGIKLPTAHLTLDTREEISAGKNNISNKLALDELNYFWEIVNDKCYKILEII